MSSRRSFAHWRQFSWTIAGLFDSRACYDLPFEDVLDHDAEVGEPVLAGESLDKAPVVAGQPDERPRRSPGWL